MTYQKNNIFWKIIEKKIKSEILYENPNFLILKDINPKDIYHYLLIPKRKFKNFSEMIEQLKMSEKFFQNIMKNLSLISKGSQVIFNDGNYQEIPHLHFHILRKKPFDFNLLKNN